MNYSKECKYPTDGESGAHGYTVEQTITYERDDIIGALVELFESDSVDSTKQTIYLGEDVDIGTWLDLEDLEAISIELNFFLDDDFGTEKVTNQLTDWFDNNIPKDAEYEIDTISYI